MTDPREKAMRRGADHDGIGLAMACRRAATFGVSPSASSSRRLAPPISPITTGPVWMPITDGERDPLLALQARVQRRDRLDDPEAGAYRAARIVLAGDRIPEVHEQTVAEVLRDVAVKRADHGVTCLLVGAHDVAEHLGIEPGGELGRADEVAEHHRELPALAALRSPLRRAPLRWHRAA